MSDDRDAVKLHVETAPFPQTIECPQCDAEMRFLIESTDIGGTRCEDCGVDIIYVHDRRGESTYDETEQKKLVTDGGTQNSPTDWNINIYLKGALLISGVGLGLELVGIGALPLVPLAIFAFAWGIIVDQIGALDDSEVNQDDE